MTYEIEILESLASVDADEWNHLAPPDNPFVDYRFLSALETSGSVGGDSGWQPCHLVLRDGDNALVGAMPLYRKVHSYGEYIFDWAWANAAYDAGIPYFPKLVSAVPFTPATGSRILTVNDKRSVHVGHTILQGVRAMADTIGASSAHILFLPEQEHNVVVEDGHWMSRLTYQFHWENQGWESFENYLQSFRRSARRNVKRERQEVDKSGLNIRMLKGDELTDEEWSSLWSFYVDTTGRKGAIPYLTREFFDQLRGTLSSMVMVAMASDADRPVAGALSFCKGTHLYGRYWGALESHSSLHFELCYYQSIEHCIRHGWSRFEAGAQGSHKLKRGLLPSATYSCHYVVHPGLKDAIARFLPREREMYRKEMKSLMRHTPFKRHANTG